jgi:hypothetical protein
MLNLPVLRDWPPAGPLKRVRSVLAAGLVLLSIITLAWVTLCLIRGHGLIHETGVLTGLAMDAAAGVFYRPLLGPDGYGGTRYGPLPILLQAAQIRVGVNPIAAGHLVVLISAAVLGWAIVRLLVRQGITTVPAVFVPLLLLVSPATEHALVETRPDVLPAALNVLGLVLAYRLRTGWRTAAGIAAAACFAAAASAKITSGFGVAAACLYLLSQRRIRTAVVLGILTAAAAGVALAAANAASGGRLWENFHTCANVAGQPRLGLAGWYRILVEVWIQDDLPGTALTAAAVCAWAFADRAVRWSLPGFYLLVTVPITLLMYFSPGLSTNQLIDVHVAAAMFLGLFLFQQSARESQGQAILTWAMSILVLVCAASALRPFHFATARFARADAFRKAVALATGRSPTDLNGCGPILSDNAAIPVAAGQRPFLLDDYMFPTVRNAVPAVQADLYRRLDDRYFAGVVLRYDPETSGRRWVLGNQFAEKLNANYDLVGRTNLWDHLWIYRAKKR